MKRIDKLLLKAKKVYGANKKYVSLGIVEPIFKDSSSSEIERWKATAILWDGVEGSCTGATIIHKKLLKVRFWQ